MCRPIYYMHLHKDPGLNYYIINIGMLVKFTEYWIVNNI